MLVLSRKSQERVIIRDANGNVLVTVMVCRIRDDKVRIGFDAPGLTVHREEVDDAVQAGEAVRSVGKHVADVLMDAIESGPELSDQ